MDDLSPEARALLDRARTGDDPSTDDRARVLQTISASIATSAAVLGAAKTAMAATQTSSAAASAAATKSAAVSFAVWLGIGAVAGTAVTGAAIVATRHPEAPAAQVAEMPAATPRSVPGARPLPGIAEQTAVSAPDVPVHADDPAARAPQRAAASASPLAEETRLLETARAALSRGDGRSALAALERHGERFPNGALMEERLASRVFAFCAVGQPAEAARAAAELLRVAPSSPLRSRVLDSCAYEK